MKQTFTTFLAKTISIPTLCARENETLTDQQSKPKNNAALVQRSEMYPVLNNQPGEARRNEMN